jgi:uncharacterized membrane protein
MTLIQYVATYLVSVPVFFAIDMVWLGFVARSFYQDRLGHLLAESVNWPVAIGFYLLFLVGLLIFAIGPALAMGDGQRALLYGALFGFFTYATYDLTNWSTLREWPASVALVDIVWGTVLSASVAYVTYLLAKMFIIQ